MSLVLTLTYFLYFNLNNLLLWYIFDICEMRENHISWEQNDIDQLGRVLIANSPVGKTFIFWHRNAVVINGKNKTKQNKKQKHTKISSKQENSFYIKK